LLVSFGKADTKGLALQALTRLSQQLRRAPPLVVLGAPLDQGAGIDALLATWPGPARRCDGLDAAAVAQLLRESRWVLASASTIAWEALLLGCQVVAVPWAENQEYSAAALVGSGAVVEPSLARAVSATLSRIAEAVPSRPGSIDPYGCWRVVAAMGFHATVPLKSVSGELDIRVVEASDCAAVWRLNNLPDYRLLSFNPSPIPWSSHLAWWGRPRGRELLGCIGGEVVAYARIHDGEVDVVVHPMARGKGIARALLGRLLRNDRAEAYVLTSNLPSRKLFAALGFHEAGQHPERPTFLRLCRDGAATMGSPPSLQE
jgi:GNAT superfamily N-acetyltransferase